MSAEHASGGLEATGERLVPEAQHGELVHAEHLVRYRLATQIARGKRVLDAASGEGYGTALLAAAGAHSATGVDIDDRTVAHARTRHPAEFLVADVSDLPFPDDSFDLVVSFETIEHVLDPERAIDEMRRVLAEDGLLVISTPNKAEYLVENEFHEREFMHDEFLALLSTRFATVDALLQHNWMLSAVVPAELAGDATGERWHQLAMAKVVALEQGGELYTIAVCGNGDLPSFDPVGVTASVDEAHGLARRTVAAERTAEMWRGDFEAAKKTAHLWRDECKRAEQTLLDVYGSVWWRMTRPLRWIADRVRRTGG